MCPDITLRSTFIAGFPGETESEFEELLSFLQEAQLDRVGCFAYSPVEGAVANNLPDPVPDEIRADRQRRFMETQTKISQEKLKNKIGREIDVLIDMVSRDGAVGRSAADAPEIDGQVHIHATDKKLIKNLKAGDFARVRVTDTNEHDLIAALIA